jgi:hypothetical protein
MRLPASWEIAWPGSNKHALFVVSYLLLIAAWAVKNNPEVSAQPRQDS